MNVERRVKKSVSVVEALLIELLRFSQLMADVQVQTSLVENEYKKELSTVWNNLKRIN